MEISRQILVLRGQRVLLDVDLAALYGVASKRLNEQVKRNRARFPVDFVFQLTMNELRFLRSQFATLNRGRGRHRKYAPMAFTEHGAIMAATVLNSPRAVEMSVYVVRAFVKLREVLASNVGARAEAQGVGEISRNARRPDAPSIRGSLRSNSCADDAGDEQIATHRIHCRSGWRLGIPPRFGSRNLLEFTSCRVEQQLPPTDLMGTVVPSPNEAHGRKANVNSKRAARPDRITNQSDLRCGRVASRALESRRSRGCKE